MRARRSFLDAWRAVPWQLKAYVFFLAALVVFEVGSAAWSPSGWLDRTARRHTLQMGYLFSIPMVVMAIAERARRVPYLLAFVLLVQALYAGTVYFLRPHAATGWIGWAILSSVFWLAMMTSGSVRRYCSAAPS